MFAVGVLAVVICAIFGYWTYAAVIGWAAASVTFVAWVWLLVGRMDAGTTASHATREDPSRGLAGLLLIVASLASLAAILVLLVRTNNASNTEQIVAAVFAVLSVALSWLLIHTLFTLRYAELYYTGIDGGVDFNQKDPPRYGDFAYLAFTLGMTFQVSDTNLTTHAVRMTALRHGLLSYLFGSVILATLINLVAGLPA